MSRWRIGTPKVELDTLALCLDIEAVERNVQRMAAYLAQTGVRLRPHSKTHKSPALAHLQMAAGAIGIACAKLGEAEVMAAAGLKDLLIANQIVGADKIARLVNLAAIMRSWLPWITRTTRPSWRAPRSRRVFVCAS